MNRPCIFMAALMLAASSFAQVPSTLGYQARLTTTSGTPATGNLSIVFSLYSANTGGAALWTETQNLTLSNGDLSVALGELTPIPPSLFDKPLFLGIKVGSDNEMTPRPKLNAAPYALRAKSTLARTTFVPASGTDLENGNALKAAVAAQGTGTTLSIQLDAGGYDLGPDSITLNSRISLIGAGRDISFIGSSNAIATIVLGGTSAVLRELSVRNVGTGSTTATEGAAAVRIVVGAHNSKLNQVNLRSELVAATTGIRCALWIEDADNVSVDRSLMFARGGASARGICASAPPNSAFNLLLSGIETQATSTATSTAIGAYLVGHRSVLIQGGRFIANGIGPSNIGLHLQESEGVVSTALINGNGDATSAGDRIGLLVTQPVGWEFKSLRVSASSPAGNGGLNIAADFNGNATNGLVHLRNGRYNVSGGTEIVGVRMSGLLLQAVGAEIGAFGHSLSTAVTAIQLLPPISGQPQSGSEIIGSRVRAFHPLTLDIGAAITTTGPNLEVDGGIIRATDDGIELGISGNLANPTAAAAVYNLRIESGRRSIRKHQNWGIALRHVDLRQRMLAEPGGYLSCLATTLNAPPEQFLATGCPTE